MRLKPLRFGVRWIVVVGLAVIVGICLGVAVLLYRLDPAKCALYPPCVLHLITGLYCPGCGSARALHQLLHGNLLMAVRFNPLLVAALPFVCYAFLMEGIRAATGSRVTTFRPRWNYAKAVLYLVVAYWVLRNVPIYPFTLLAPGGVAPWR